MQNYQLKLEYYQGPLDKLLELIEEKKLPVSDVALAAVTADFLDYLEQFKIAFGPGDAVDENSPLFDAPPELLADFLVIASRLLLIKSKSLLPSLELSTEEEAEIKDLEHRLKLYQELKRTQEHVRSLWSDMPKLYAREFLNSTEPLFYPPKGVTPEMLFGSVLKVVGTLEELFKPKATVRNQIVHLREKIQEIVARLSATPMNFSELHAGKGKGELVVMFLAVLHLIKQQLVNVEQGGHFAAITIAKAKPPEYNNKES